MFLRSTIRRKDGKEHRYWSVVEAHIFIAFLAYALHVTLKRRLAAPRARPHPAQRAGEGSPPCK